VLDLLMLALLIIGFAAAFGYARVCAKVTQPINGSKDQPR
jgi:hypothetical protein